MAKIKYVVPILTFIFGVIFATLISSVDLYYTHFYDPNILIATVDKRVRIGVYKGDENKISILTPIQVSNGGKKTNIIKDICVYIRDPQKSEKICNVFKTYIRSEKGKLEEASNFEIKSGEMITIGIQALFNTIDFYEFSNTETKMTKFGLEFTVIDDDLQKYHTIYDIGEATIEVKKKIYHGDEILRPVALAIPKKVMNLILNDTFYDNGTYIEIKSLDVRE